MNASSSSRRALCAAVAFAAFLPLTARADTDGSRMAEYAADCQRVLGQVNLALAHCGHQSDATVMASIAAHKCTQTTQMAGTPWVYAQFPAVRDQAVSAGAAAENAPCPVINPQKKAPAPLPKGPPADLVKKAKHLCTYQDGQLNAALVALQQCPAQAQAFADASKVAAALLKQCYAMAKRADPAVQTIFQKTIDAVQHARDTAIACHPPVEPHSAEEFKAALTQCVADAGGLISKVDNVAKAALKGHEGLSARLHKIFAAGEKLVEGEAHAFEDCESAVAEANLLLVKGVIGAATATLAELNDARKALVNSPEYKDLKACEGDAQTLVAGWVGSALARTIPGRSALERLGVLATPNTNTAAEAAAATASCRKAEADAKKDWEAAKAQAARDEAALERYAHAAHQAEQAGVALGEACVHGKAECRAKVIEIVKNAIPEGSPRALPAIGVSGAVDVEGVLLKGGVSMSGSVSRTGDTLVANIFFTKRGGGGVGAQGASADLFVKLGQGYRIEGSITNELANLGALLVAAGVQSALERELTPPIALEAEKAVGLTGGLVNAKFLAAHGVTAASSQVCVGEEAGAGNKVGELKGKESWCAKIGDHANGNVNLTVSVGSDLSATSSAIADFLKSAHLDLVLGDGSLSVSQGLTASISVKKCPGFTMTEDGGDMFGQLIHKCARSQADVELSLHAGAGLGNFALSFAALASNPTADLQLLTNLKSKDAAAFVRSIGKHTWSVQVSWASTISLRDLLAKSDKDDKATPAAAPGAKPAAYKAPSASGKVTGIDDLDLSLKPQTLCSGTWDLNGVVPALHGQCDGPLIKRFKAFQAWAAKNAR